MDAEQHETHVLMTRRVAARWLTKMAKPQYRIRVLFGSREIRNLPSLLDSLRDGKIAMQGVPSVPDLGINTDFDGIDLWSSQPEGIVALQQWFEKRGFETTGMAGVL
jgi:hypothetical protein